MGNFLRIKDVMKMTGIAKSTIWLWVSEGKFPKPIKLSPRITIKLCSFEYVTKSTLSSFT